MPGDNKVLYNNSSNINYSCNFIIKVYFLIDLSSLIDALMLIIYSNCPQLPQYLMKICHISHIASLILVALQQQQKSILHTHSTFLFICK